MTKCKNCGHKMFYVGLDYGNTKPYVHAHGHGMNTAKKCNCDCTNPEPEEVN